MDGVADRVPAFAAEPRLQPSSPERHGLDRLVVCERFAAEDLTQALFNEAAQRGVRCCRLTFRTNKEVVGNLYGCLHLVEQTGWLWRGEAEYLHGRRESLGQFRRFPDGR